MLQMLKIIGEVQTVQTEVATMKNGLAKKGNVCFKCYIQIIFWPK